MNAIYVMMRETLWKSRLWLAGAWLSMLLSVSALYWDSTGRWHSLGSLPMFIVGGLWLVWLRSGGLKRTSSPGESIDQVAAGWWHKPFAEFSVVVLAAYLPAVILGVCLQQIGGTSRAAILNWLLTDVALWTVVLWIAYNFTAMRSRYAMVAPIVFWLGFNTWESSNYHSATWPRDVRTQLIWLAITALCALATFWRPKTGSFVFASLMWFGWCGDIVASRTLPNAEGRGEGKVTADALTLAIDSVSIERAHVLRVAFHIDATVDGDAARLADEAHVTLDSAREERVIEVVHLNQPSNVLVKDMGDSVHISDAIGLLGVTTFRDRNLSNHSSMLLSPVVFRRAANFTPKRADGVAIVGVFDIQPHELASLSLSARLEISDVQQTRRLPWRVEATPRGADSVVRLVRSGLIEPEAWGLRRTYFDRRAERIQPLGQPQRNGSLRAELRTADGRTLLLPLSPPARSTSPVLPALYHQINDAEVLLPYSRLGRPNDTLIVQSLSAAKWYSVAATLRGNQVVGGGR